MILFQLGICADAFRPMLLLWYSANFPHYIVKRRPEFLLKMSVISISSSKAGLRNLRQCVCISRHVQKTSTGLPRALHTSKNRAEQKLSFRGQLYESTQRRLEKERQEQQRFARERGEVGSGRAAATLFGNFSIIAFHSIAN